MNKSHDKSLVVVPYRDRPENLTIFINTFNETYVQAIPNVDLCIVEQTPGKNFNRGLIKNIGGIYAQTHNYKYILFNDVDWLSSGVLLDRVCTQTDWDAIVLHSGHQECFGGIVRLTTDSFHACNGFPSDLWEWGLEDRLLYYRYKINNMSICPWVDNKAHVKSLCVSTQHRKWPYRGAMLERYNTEKAIFNCGDIDKQLNYIQQSGVNTADYTVLETTVQDNITTITVQV